MKTCIDIRPTYNAHATRGVGILVRNLLRVLEQQCDAKDQLFLVEPGRDLSSLPRVSQSLPCPRLPRLHNLNWAFNQLLVPRLLKHHGVNLFCATDFHSYIIPPSGVKQVALAYDLIPFLFPETMAEQPFLSRIGLKLNFRNLRRCHSIVSISEATKQDLTRFMGIPPEKIRVIYPGIDHSLFNQENAVRPMKDPSREIGVYFLYVGDPEWRKNLRGVLEALAGMPDNVRLIIAGKLAPKDLRLRQWLDETNTTGRVLLPGFVPDDDLPRLYGHAVGFVFPTRYEGFGLPVAEAMACGCPVITSRNSSLPEVAGPAALYIDPARSEDIREAMLTLLHNRQQRESLSSQGLVQVQRFTWEQFGSGVRAALIEAGAHPSDQRCC